VKTDGDPGAPGRAGVSDAGAGPTLSFRPLNVGRWFIWGLTAIVFVTLPLVFEKKFALALMSQGGIMIIFAL